MSNDPNTRDFWAQFSNLPYALLDMHRRVIALEAEVKDLKEQASRNKTSPKGSTAKQLTRNKIS